MDEKITVLNAYTIFVGKGIIQKLDTLFDLKKYSKVFVATDEVIKKNFSEKIEMISNDPSSFIIIGAGEQFKNIETIEKIWRTLLQNGADRKSLVVNIGGGVICDIGGFAASTYMRGIDFINIPTTLLSQVDASVGGKTGIDFEGVKNLVGTFTQPKAVFCDIELLSTLPEREFISGFGEIIKHGLIVDKDYFDFVASRKPLEFNPEELLKVVSGSIKIKANIVNQDEKEGNKRKLLNFGHTIGHAVEALSLETKNPLLHGEAVSIGMGTEAYISMLLGFISENDYRFIQTCLKNAGLPVSIFDLTLDNILEKMKSDKKNEKGTINFTLLKGLGNASYNQIVPDEVISKAISLILS